MQIEHMRYLAVALRLRYLYILFVESYSIRESGLARQFLFLLGDLFGNRIFI